MFGNFGEGPSGYGCRWIQESPDINSTPHQDLSTPTTINQMIPQNNPIGINNDHGPVIIINEDEKSDAKNFMEDGAFIPPLHVACPILEGSTSPIVREIV